jgi:hypothetical protein
MIPNHKQFIDAIAEKKKVCLRFYSKADTGVIDLVCAPMDYGPGPNAADDVNRYWFWDYSSNTGTPTLSLSPEQVLDVRILGQVFDPADFNAPPVNVLPFPNLAAAQVSAAPIHSAPAAGTEQQLDLPATEVQDKLNRSKNHESLWKNTNTQTKTT